MSAETFKCGHPKTPENSQRAGQRRDGSKIVKCKTCHLRLARKSAEARYKPGGKLYVENPQKRGPKPQPPGVPTASPRELLLQLQRRPGNAWATAEALMKDTGKTDGKVRWNLGVLKAMGYVEETHEGPGRKLVYRLTEAGVSFIEPLKETG